ncbi:MAG: hypothetical protein ACQERN_05205 [Thermodesulfobacteriota bacterium]
MNATALLIVLSLFFLLGVYLYGFALWLYMRSRSQWHQTRQALDFLAGKIDRLETADNVGAGTARPEKQMDVAALKSRMASTGFCQAEVPEKYGYVARLAESGLGVQEIESILDVSAGEAEQMLALARSCR